MQTQYYKAGELYEVLTESGEVFRGRLDGVCIDQGNECRLVFYSLQDKKMRTCTPLSLASVTPILSSSQL
jgi:hypothetical protein